MKHHSLLAFTLAFLCCAPAPAADVKRGEQLFAGTCAQCHPNGGNVLAPEKELKGANFARKYPTDAALVNVVRKGIPNTVMSPFPKDRLSDEQLADVIAFVRSMTPAAPSNHGTGGRKSPSSATHGAAKIHGTGGRKPAPSAPLK